MFKLDKCKWFQKHNKKQDRISWSPNMQKVANKEVCEKGNQYRFNTGLDLLQKKKKRSLEWDFAKYIYICVCESLGYLQEWGWL